MNNDELILQTELDFLVESIKQMRRLKQDQGVIASQDFRVRMEEYFRLGRDTKNSFVYDDLLRLADTPAGTLSSREWQLLDRLHKLRFGEYLRIYGRLCSFRYHTTQKADKRDGFFEYSYHDERGIVRTMDYNTAWTLAQEGSLTFGD